VWAVLAGLGLGAILLLPAVARGAAGPQLALPFAGVAALIALGEEIAFRGTVYSALDELGGARLAIGGSTLAFVIAHVLSHPPVFLLPVAAMGLLLSVWRWAFNDLLAPITAHVLADLAW